MTEYIMTKNPHVQAHSIPSMWRSVQKRDEYRVEYANLWNSTATSIGPNGEPEDMVDVILSPAGPSSAPKLETAKWWGYTSQWNLLDYPAIVFPVDQVDTLKDSAKLDYTPRNEQDKFNWDLWEKYGAEGYKDAPVSLQLIGRRSVSYISATLGLSSRCCIGMKTKRLSRLLRSSRAKPECRLSSMFSRMIPPRKVGILALEGCHSLFRGSEFWPSFWYGAFAQNGSFNVQPSTRQSH